MGLDVERLKNVLARAISSEFQNERETSLNLAKAMLKQERAALTDFSWTLPDAALPIIAGFKPTYSSSLRKQVDDLTSENVDLRDEVKRLTGEIARLNGKLVTLDDQVASRSFKARDDGTMTFDKFQREVIMLVKDGISWRRIAAKQMGLPDARPFSTWKAAKSVPKDMVDRARDANLGPEKEDPSVPKVAAVASSGGLTWTDVEAMAKVLHARDSWKPMIMRRLGLPLADFGVADLASLAPEIVQSLHDDYDVLGPTLATWKSSKRLMRDIYACMLQQRGRVATDPQLCRMLGSVKSTVRWRRIELYNKGFIEDVTREIDANNRWKALHTMAELDAFLGLTS